LVTEQAMSACKEFGVKSNSRYSILAHHADHDAFSRNGAKVIIRGKFPSLCAPSQLTDLRPPRIASRLELREISLSRHSLCSFPP
jgi:hypothetical protein